MMTSVLRNYELVYCIMYRPIGVLYFGGLSHAETDTIQSCNVLEYSSEGYVSKSAECECNATVMTETISVDNTHIISMSIKKWNLGPLYSSYVLQLQFQPLAFLHAIPINSYRYFYPCEINTQCSCSQSFICCKKLSHFSMAPKLNNMHSDPILQYLGKFC